MRYYFLKYLALIKMRFLANESPFIQFPSEHQDINFLDSRNHVSFPHIFSAACSRHSIE